MDHFKGTIGNAHAPVSRDRVVGVIQNPIFVISDPNLPIHYITFMGATMTIKGSLHGASPIVKRFSDENFPSPVKTGPKMAVFREYEGLNVKFLFYNPEKAHPSSKPRRLTYCA